MKTLWSALLSVVLIACAPVVAMAAQKAPLANYGGVTQTLKSGDTVPVPNGGTGVTTSTAHGVLVGEGSSPVAATAAGTAGKPLLSGGGSADPAYGTLTVPGGGTGATTLTTHCVLVGQGTAVVTVACPTMAGYVLTDNGPGADPTFQAATGGGGSPGGSSGQPQYNNAGSFGGFTFGGDCTFSVPNLTCTKTSGASFGYFATGTDAANLTGTVSVNRFNSGTGASGSTYLDGTGHWTTPSGGSGTVTSVALSLPGIFNVSGSPVTTSGTLTGALATQSANLVFAGPTTGAAAAPTFRSLVGGDLPNPSATTLGGIESLASTSHKWINAISTSGAPSATQPACADLSDAVASCNTDATNAANIGSGNLAAARITANLSAALDTAFGSTQGMIIVRGSSAWINLGAGTSGFALVSNGPGATPSYQAIGGGGGGVTADLKAARSADFMTAFGGL